MVPVFPVFLPMIISSPNYTQYSLLEALTSITAATALDTNPEAVSNCVFHRHDPLRQAKSQAKEDKKRPLPSEWVKRHAEDEPPDQLQVGEEVECSNW